MLKKIFNKAHHTYDLNADLQKNTGENLLQFIQSKSLQYQNIMDIGCGTGFTTEQFAKKLQYQNFQALDIANNLLTKAKERLQHFPIQWIENDFHTFHTSTSFDLIYSNMALHWSADILSILPKLLHLLKKNGVFAFSIPLAGTLIELAPHVNLIEWIEKESILQRFNVSFYKTQKIILSFPSMLQALQSIKKIGANYTGKKILGLHRNPFLKKLLLNPSNDSTTLTYHIGYFLLEL